MTIGWVESGILFLPKIFLSTIITGVDSSSERGEMITSPSSHRSDYAY
jgi:hypothetical protein